MYCVRPTIILLTQICAILCDKINNYITIILIINYTAKLKTFLNKCFSFIVLQSATVQHIFDESVDFWSFVVFFHFTMISTLIYND